MKTRLGIFIAALLLLPLAGFLLAGAQWDDLRVDAVSGEETIAATLRTSLTLLFYVLLVNHTVKRLTGKAPLDNQRIFYIGVAAASAVFCWLLCYLNLYVASWTVPQDNGWLLQLLLYTPIFALLAPGVLITRALLGSFPGLLKAMNCSIRLPVLEGETLARLLIATALTGLAGGAAWPEKLAWLLWASPLALLMAMQFLWHESSVFSGLKSGDWGRVLCTSLAGIAVGNIALGSYQASLILPQTYLAQTGFVLFGLTCMQLSDVIAENWRGKTRGEVFTGRKKFPIPVVVKK